MLLTASSNLSLFSLFSPQSAQVFFLLCFSNTFCFSVISKCVSKEADVFFTHGDKIFTGVPLMTITSTTVELNS